MKNINIFKILEANKENRNFQAVPNRQNRIQSTMNFKEEFPQVKAKQNVIRVSKWNKSSHLRPRLQEEHQRQVSYELPKQRPEPYQHGQRALKNRSLTNIQIPSNQQVPSTHTSIPQSANCKNALKSQQSQLQNVFPYNEDILQYLIQRTQSIKKLTYNGFAIQNQITLKMRNILLNWLYEVHSKLKLQSETFFITINLIDSYLEKQCISKVKLQLVGITCLFIAAKYQEVYSIPKSSHLARFCDDIYTRDDILRMEGDILLSIGFDLTIITPLRIIEQLGQMEPLIRLISD